MQKKCVYNTWCSQAVTHLSTNHARPCLTSVIGREPVFSGWYGRRHTTAKFYVYKLSKGFERDVSLIFLLFCDNRI